MDEHVIRTYVRAPEVFVGGEGCRLFDADGRTYLDFLGGIAVSALGHAHPKLVEALRDQAGKVLHVSNLYRHPYTEQVAASLSRLGGMEAVFFTNSGAEANEGALKIARKHQYAHGAAAGGRGRTGFLALHRGFHGRTMGALSVTHTKSYREPFEPLIPGVEWVEPGDVDALIDAVNRLRPAALILEPIQGEGGIHDLPLEYLRAARRICTETATVLIHDEVQCGSGRTGTFLAGDHADIKPDIATLAKPIGAGLPVGLILVSDEFASTLVPGDHGSTFAGGPMVCRAMQVVLDELENGLMNRVVEAGARLRAGLEDLAGDFPGHVHGVRGRGLMLGMPMGAHAKPLQQWLYAHGLITNVCGGDVLRLLPPYVVTDEDIDEALALLRQGLEQL